MDMENVLHMKGGLGNNSYAQNSSLQRKSMETLKRMIISAAEEAYTAATPESMLIADLGCAAGPNSLSLVGGIIGAVGSKSREAGRPVSEFVVFLNDLPTNDFNAMFTSVPEFAGKMKDGEGAQVFLAGVPGTFYGRLFAEDWLHFIFSCYSLHWLSQVPFGLFNEEGKSINKGNPYISDTSPPEVAKAYFRQFQKDFSLFLESRSKELKAKGLIALLLLGRRAQDHQDKATNFLWDILAKSFSVLISQGLVEEEKADSYNVPFYAPSPKEIEDEVHREGSFAIEHLEVWEISSSSGDAKKDAVALAMSIRAIQESMLKHHFGEEIIEPLFHQFSELLTKAMQEEEEIKGVHLAVVLRKLD